MARLVLLAGIVLGCAGSVQGDPVVARGDAMIIWLEGAVGPSFQVRFGYHDFDLPDWAIPSTIVGDDLWFAQLGIYDLSGDPQISGFVSYATNGITDILWLRFFDQQNIRLDFPLGESVWLGQFPDLAPLTITGAQLRVEEITPQANGVQLVIQMEYLGVPEPGSILLAAGIALIVSARRRRTSPAVFQ